MVDFEIAQQWLNEGKKIRRAKWQPHSYIYDNEEQGICYCDGTPAKIYMNQLNALDWEIYKEYKSFEDRLKSTLKELKNNKTIIFDCPDPVLNIYNNNQVENIILKNFKGYSE
jgi:hypothetical protein